jgi:endogenous inhibitor of DNA gyrase (YacG/DUF329 family)
MLLELMLSTCHECGKGGDFTQNLDVTHYKESMYLLSFKCPECGNTSQVLASESDIRRLLHK